MYPCLLLVPPTSSLLATTHMNIVWQKNTYLFLDRNYSICNEKLLITSGLGQHSRYSNSLLNGWSRHCILLREKISAPVQTSPGAHLLHNGYQVIPEGTVTRQGINVPPPSTTKVKERVELYLYSPSLPSYHVVGCTLTFTVKNKLCTKSA